MAAQRKTVVGVVFGGRSVEHDVSIVTGHQIMRAFDKEHYEVIPIYITRDGKWYSGAPLLQLDTFKNLEILNQKEVQAVILSPDVRHHGLIINPVSGYFGKSEVKRLDVLFPAIHGSHGEDGTLQGLCELADIPYVGCGTLASALTNDKIMTKAILRQNDVPVLDDIWFTRAEWLDNPDSIIEKIKAQFDYPLFVKPATLGSSIGVSRVDNDELLRISIDIAANFDRRVMVEPAVVNGIEINCAVMGFGNQFETSVLEQPLSWAEFLSYEDKYLRGNEGMKSADRIIPAPITDELTARIRQLTEIAFRAVDGRGIARVDYLVRPDKHEVYLNELNTMPGSLAFYLWQESGLSPSDVVHQLVKLAREAHVEKRRNVYDYQTNLINVAIARGVKGTKGVKTAAPTQKPNKN